MEKSKKIGKNHILVNGIVLQTNKKWSQLKQRQVDWIYEITRAEHSNFIEKNNRIPRKTGKRLLIDIVVAKFQDGNIWLPLHELETGIGKYID
ncbi:MAG: transposase [Firmicutes bacterium]|nr:transposase [Bacillota bacterium]